MSKEKKKLKKSYLKSMKKEKGITLVALVITIIIIIILSTVTINMTFGDNGLIKQAQLAKNMAENSTMSEQENMDSLSKEYANLIAEDAEVSLPDTRSEIEKAQDEGTIFNNQTELSDSKGNIVTIPAGFKIADDSGDTVQKGIVIEDVSASADAAVQGSQYVWIPVGSFVNDAGETKEVTLGRYTFNTTDGTPTLVQDAANYTDQSDTVAINSYYKELVDYREGVASSGLDGENATAKDLEGFLNSARENGGYYIGRYEASYASGDSSNYASCKAASKVSNGYSEESMSYSAGRLWNFITQLNASKVAINTYAESTSVTSDLMNSYAWDTAIVYIQQAGNSNYANQIRVYTSLSNTGNLAEGVKDEVCKINDMASNVIEWTTEYSSNTYSIEAYPCVYRGGVYNLSNRYSAYRTYTILTNTYNSYGFRVQLYLQTEM